MEDPVDPAFEDKLRLEAEIFAESASEIPVSSVVSCALFLYTTSVDSILPDMKLKLRPVGCGL